MKIESTNSSVSPFLKKSYLQVSCFFRHISAPHQLYGMFLQGPVQGWANNGQRQGEGSRNLAKMDQLLKQSSAILTFKKSVGNSHKKIVKMPNILHDSIRSWFQRRCDSYFLI